MLDWLRVTAKPVMYNEQVCHVNTLLTLLKAALKKWVAGWVGKAHTGLLVCCRLPLWDAKPACNTHPLQTFPNL